MATEASKGSELTGLLVHGLELFFGEATDAQARAYARLGEVPSGDWSLSGTISGPTSHYAQTLTSTQRFVSLAGKPSLLAEALVLDPCFWTPATPNVYTAHIELLQHGKAVAQIDRLFGIRPLGAAGKNLFLDNKRWVLRAVDARAVAPGAELSRWRGCQAAMIAPSASDSLCASASRLGVLLVAEISASDDLESEIRRLARWPAVGLAVIKHAGSLAGDLKRLAPNLPLVHSMEQASESFAASSFTAPWSSAVMVPADRPEQIRMAASVNRPVIVSRSATEQRCVVEARALCDALQRDTAALGDFAGYVIGAQ